MTLAKVSRRADGRWQVTVKYDRALDAVFEDQGSARAYYTRVTRA